MTSTSAILSIIRLAKPAFRSQEDKLAFAVHAYVLGQGYKLVAVGPNASNGQPDDDQEEVDNTGWNTLDGSYAFQYQDVEGKGRPGICVKCRVSGNMLVVQWLTTGSSASFSDPSSGKLLNLETGKYTTNVDKVPEAYQNMGSLMEKLDTALGHSLGVEKPQLATAARDHPPEEQPLGERVYNREKEEEDPAYYPARRGGFEQPPPGVPATAVGYEDVVPPGVLRPPGVHPTGGIPGFANPFEPMPHQGGGMHVGPGHPIFGPGRLSGSGVGGVSGPGEGSPLPPGARWDPIGPPGTRGFRPDPPRQSGRGGGRPPVHPDMMQPGPGGGTDWTSFYG